MMTVRRRSPSPMPSTKIALYRASLLADNLGIRLCPAAVMVMPSALVFLLPVLALLGAPDDATLPACRSATAARSGPCSRSRSASASRRRGCASSSPAGGCCAGRGCAASSPPASALGIVAIVLELACCPATESQQDAGWLLLASLAVITFLLAGTLGQPRTDRLHRI